MSSYLELIISIHALIVPGLPWIQPNQPGVETAQTHVIHTDKQVHAHTGISMND